MSDTMDDQLRSLRHIDFADFLSPIEDVIEDARNGRMFILVDHEERENEGDLVIPAQMAGPDAINFMAKYGRGLICLAITQERAEHLGLELMSRKNQTRHQTAFTVSIEAKHGVSTGISAHDRARTISVAIDPNSRPDDIVTPGHVFPLVARDGGVLVRTGHTEAAVDIARLAGLNPSGVICEIMNDDGTMARLPDLVKFAQLLFLAARRTRRREMIGDDAVIEIAYDHNDAPALLSDNLHRLAHGVVLIALDADEIVEKTRGVHAHQHRPGRGDIAFHQRDMLNLVD